MGGLVVFRDLGEALKAGYQVYDRIPGGYLLRIRTRSGWAMALVTCT